MFKNKNKIILIVSIFLIICSSFCLFFANSNTDKHFIVSAETTDNGSGGEYETHGLGAIPEPSLPKQQNEILSRDTRVVLPESYDARIYQSSVKNQQQSGTCWAFGSASAIEASAVQNGFAQINVAAGDNISVYHMATTLSSANGNSTYGYSERPNVNDGGNANMVGAYIMRDQLNGLVKESDDPYTLPTNGTFNSRNLSVTQSKAPSYSVSNVLRITTETSNITNIKQAIMNYGAVTTHINVASDFNSINGFSAYYLDTARSPVYNDAGHLVTIVGWDDNFSKTNFRTGSDSKGLAIKQPLNSGAWLVKNSWGTSWGMSGYCWISYEDANAGTDCYAFETVENYDNSEIIYDYDPLGYGAYYNASQNFSFSANVFTAKSAGEYLKEIRFFSAAAETVTFYYVPNYTGTSSLNITGKTQVAKITTSYPGYYTVPVSSYPAITGTYAIVAKFDSKIIPLSPSSISGKSFVSSGGTTAWSNVGTSYVASIKAVTTYTPPKPAINLSDLNYTIPTNHIYNASPQGIGTVTVKTEITGYGSITVKYNDSTNLPVDAGSYTVTAEIAEGTVYGAGTLTLGSYSIGKAVLTVTANDKTRDYGAANPLFDWTITGWLGSDTINNIIITNSGNFSATCTANSTTNAGTYSINMGSSSPAPQTTNYSFTCRNGTLTILQKSITKPSVTGGPWTYNESSQGPDFSSDPAYTVTGNKQTNAGNYNVTVTLNSTVNYKWADGSTSPLSLPWSILAASVTRPVISGGPWIYSGNSQGPDFASNSAYTVTGNKQTNIGNYFVTVTLKTANYKWDNGSTAPLSLPWSISYAFVNRPVVSGGPWTYNGNLQGPDFASNSAYTISGNKQTNAGDYFVTVTLVSTTNFQWDNGSVSPLSLPWSILKTVFTVTSNGVNAVFNNQPQMITFNNLQNNDIVQYSLAQDGTYSAVHPECINAGTYKIFYKVSRTNYYDVTGSSVITITKADPIEPELLTVISFSRGKTLKDVELPAGWVWEAPDTKLTEGQQTCYAVYVDDGNHNQARTAVTFTAEEEFLSKLWNDNKILIIAAAFGFIFLITVVPVMIYIKDKNKRGKLYNLR